ncbi:MAG: MFS transporter [Saprospiraceae bacterium]|jgi:UMF1 family MFS transporter|nr:MFS transporter [Saprospiraceae bacterium]MBP9209883.1 MFS transporter [Saprospiraceae bacterium]MBV6472710.1 hypothetical protein [Saprospiraceae bacterium]
MNQLYKNKLGYAFYDFANSGYVLLFQAFLFPLFISSHYTDSSAAAQVWGYILFFSNLLAILSAPLIGRVADLKDRIKIFSILILSVSLLSFLSVLNNNVLVILIFFVIFNSSFELSQSIYDSFLNVISKNRDEKIDISTFAWGFGYLGGILFVLVYFVLNKNGIENKYILASAALLYFIFSFLSVFLLKKADQAHTRTFVNEMTNKNLKLFKLSKEIIYSLVIYFIVFLSTTAIINFSTLFFNKELHIEEKTIGMIMLAGQLLAFPLTILSGKMAKKFGILNTIRYCLIVWGIGLVCLVFAKTVIHVGIIVFIFSFVIGSTQSLIRAHFSTIINTNRISEYYGYYGVSNKTGALISPLLVTLSIEILGSIRYVFSVIFILILIGYIITNKLERN